MALHLTHQEHDADPPAQWQVVKVTRTCWQLRGGNGGVIDTFSTKSAAAGAKQAGPWVTLYEKEGRWFKGEPVYGWRPYSEIEVERARRKGAN